MVGLQAAGGRLTGLGLHSRDGDVPETGSGGLHDLMNLLNATELFTSKQLIY